MIMTITIMALKDRQNKAVRNNNDFQDTSMIAIGPTGVVQ